MFTVSKRNLQSSRVSNLEAHHSSRPPRTLPKFPQSSLAPSQMEGPVEPTAEEKAKEAAERAGSAMLELAELVPTLRGLAVPNGEMSPTKPRKPCHFDTIEGRRNNMRGAFMCFWCHESVSP